MAFVIIAGESTPKIVGLESLELTPDAVGIQSVLNATRPGIARIHTSKHSKNHSPERNEGTGMIQMGNGTGETRFV